MSAALRVALTGVRDELRDLDSLPLLSTLVDVLTSDDDTQLRRIAEELVDWFAYDEPSLPFAALETALDADTTTV